MLWLPWRQLECASVADPERVRGSVEPPLESKLFHFRGEFWENVGEMVNSKLLGKFEPLVQKSWIRPCAWWGRCWCALRGTFHCPLLPLVCVHGPCIPSASRSASGCLCVQLYISLGGTASAIASPSFLKLLNPPVVSWRQCLIWRVCQRENHQQRDGVWMISSFWQVIGIWLSWLMIFCM